MASTDAIIEWIPRLRRYARALTGDRATADDLVQDTLERAMVKFGLWRQGSDLRAWLFTIMHNLYLNQLRGKPGFVPLDELEASGHMPFAVVPDSEFGDLVKCLTRLSHEHREVLLLIGLEDMSYQEAAKVLGVPIGTVMSRLSRGRERLSSLMSGDMAESGPAGLRVVK